MACCQTHEIRHKSSQPCPWSHFSVPAVDSWLLAYECLIWICPSYVWQWTRYIIQWLLATECKRVSVAIFMSQQLGNTLERQGKANRSTTPMHTDVYDLIYLCMGTGCVYQPLRRWRHIVEVNIKCKKNSMYNPCFCSRRSVSYVRTTEACYT